MNDHNKYIVIVVLLDFPLAMDVVLMNKGRRGRECMVVGFASSNPAYGEVYSVYFTVLHIWLDCQRWMKGYIVKSLFVLLYIIFLPL